MNVVLHVQSTPDSATIAHSVTFVERVAARRSFNGEDVGAGDDRVQWSLPGWYLVRRGYRVGGRATNGFGMGGRMVMVLPLDGVLRA
jgi:hypothetical protein